MARGLVEGTARLVGEHHPGVRRQRAGYRDSLRLPAGHVGGAAISQIGNTDLRQDLVGLRQRGATPGAGEQQRQRHVLAGRELRDQLAVLEDETELAQAQVGALRIGHFGEVLAREQHPTVVRDQHPRQAVQEGGLAGTGGPHDGDGLPGGDGEGDSGQCLDRAEALGDVVGGQQGR